MITTNYCFAAPRNLLVAFPVSCTIEPGFIAFAPKCICTGRSGCVRFRITTRKLLWYSWSFTHASPARRCHWPQARWPSAVSTKTTSLLSKIALVSGKSWLGSLWNLANPPQLVINVFNHVISTRFDGWEHFMKKDLLRL
jgi:hypothetical protein